MTLVFQRPFMIVTLHDGHNVEMLNGLILPYTLAPSIIYILYIIY